MSRIWIKAYKRKNGVSVKGHYTKDQGLLGRTPKSKRVLPKPKKGELSKFGYYDIKHKHPRTRKIALHKAVKYYGYKKVMRKVNLLRNYNKNNPILHKILSKDVEYLKAKMKPRYSKTQKQR